MGDVSHDYMAFEAMVGQLMSPQNDVRQHAEETFARIREQPDLCGTNLAAVLRRSANAESRAFCAVLLRKVLTKDDVSLWPKFSPQVQALIKTELLNCIKDEQERSIVKKVCDTISEIAAGIMEGAGWPELLPFMFQCVQSGDARLVESALLIFAQLAHYVMGTLKAYMGTLNQVLQGCMGHASIDIRIAAMRAATAFIQELEDPADRDKFQPMLPAMLQTIAFALNAGEEVAAQEALEMFIEVAESHPRFLRRQLIEVVGAMLQIAEADALEDSTRQLAAEFLVTLCEAREKAPGMMRKLPQFIGRLFQCLLGFLLDIEDEPAWHEGESDKFESEGEGERYEFGQECLDRIALALGGKTIVPLASQMLPALMLDPDWKKRHAALICLAQIAEGCVKVMLKQLDGLVDMCLKGLQDPHAKVRWAACQALGQMCTDLGPDIQNEQHQRIVPALLAVMDDFSQPRVQAHASAAIVNFSESCDQNLLPPYLDTLIHKLLMLLQNGKKLVQEGALTAMASVADCAKTHFETYYDNVMPLLRHILTNANEKTHQLLRAKALECISLVGMAVGRERFRQDAHDVMRFMQALQAQQLDPDDPTSSYMLQAGARICKCLGEEFLPYLNIVMPQLLASAQLKPDVHITDNDSDGEDEDDDEVETIYLGDRKISIRTSVLEEKATACNMLCCYADELKEGFYPYVEQVTHIMVPLLKFYFHEEVRQAAVQAMPELLRSAKLASEKPNGPNLALVKQMLDYIWAPITEAMQKEPDTEVLSDMLEAVEEIVDIVGPALLSSEQLGMAFERFKTVLETSTQRRMERLQRQQAEDFDDEEAEALEEENEAEEDLLDLEENEAEEDLLDQVSSCLTVILKQFKDGAMPFIDALMPQLGQLLAPTRSPEERRVGICVMDDILEHAPAIGQKYMQQILPVLLGACRERDPNLRQCAVYGVGVLAEHRPDAFQTVAAEAIANLVAVISAPNARSDDDEMATDNAISSLGKILEHHPSMVDGAALGATWVNSLPLTSDVVEAKAVHAQLVRFIEASDPRILGEGNAHLAKIVQILVQVLSKKPDLAEAETIAKMVLLLQQMQSSLPQAVFQGFFAQLKPHERDTLQKLMQPTA
ncbi:hypothetical protein WJX72_003666 [[Myrmecia] bisecta]|uniref:TOG domain-containing protein n=1 Tax=[Myrmecia] bisecta TaxID=41462 RepID=A0AAW1PNG1_9CHLO